MHPCILCVVCFHRVLHRIFGLWLLLYYSCLHSAFSLVLYFTSLLSLSYYTMSIPYFISLAIYLSASVCLCSRHSFQCMFMIQLIDTRMLIYVCHLAFVIPLVGEFRLPWILMSRSRSLELVNSPSCWLEWHSESMDVDKSSEPYSSRPPACLSSFSSINSWAPFVLFILVHLLVFPQLRLSMI